MLREEESLIMITYRELSSLSNDLGFSAKALYAVSNHLHQHYRKVMIPKGNGKYPLHALMWWNEILIESGVLVDGFEPDAKHLVLHHNMFGPSAEVCNTTPVDLHIYCYKRNKICIPDCKKCKYFRGDENGLGIACEWEDFEGNISWDESVIQHCERALEYDRVQYAKTTLCKKDLDRYMEWLKNYEK